MKKLKTIEMQRLSVEQFKAAGKLKVTVVLDNVRSAYNVGAVFRTCDAFRIQGVLLCGITSTPPDVEIHKTALGAEESVDWKHYDRSVEAVNDLKRHGYTVYAVEQAHGSTPLQDLSLAKELTDEARFAIVLGNEVHGVSQEVVDLCDECLEIPQFGTKHSLNVSVTAGIVLWDFARQLNPLLCPDTGAY